MTLISRNSSKVGWPSWSKAPHSSCGLERGVGSNPTSTILFCFVALVCFLFLLTVVDLGLVGGQTIKSCLLLEEVSIHPAVDLRETLGKRREKK